MGLGSMAMTALGGLLAMLAGLLRDIAQLTVSPSGLTALALGGAAVLAGAVLATAVLALLTSVASLSRTTAASGSRWRRNAARQDFSRSADSVGSTGSRAALTRGPAAASSPHPS